MHFGQFLDHDLTLTPEQDRECCEQAVLQEDLKYPEELRYCFNIDVTDDSFYRGKRDCLPFTRSDPICTEDDSREQINALSAFIDGGAVYGSDLDTATRLRTLEDGLMKTHRLGPSLPTSRMTGLEEEMEGDRLVGGDVRATVQPGLTSMHTLFLNEHNRIAENLGAVNSSLDDEELYQRSRMIVIAELQNIVYDEFLPSVIGPNLMKTLDLELPADNEDSLYDIFTNPGITNEFASVAFRFGHSLIPNFLKISKSPELRTDSVNCPIKDNFFISEDFVIGSDLSGKAWQNLLLGSSGAQTRPFDPLFSETITNFLFCGDNCRLASGFGQDLVARNIQRGRDHGLPGYTKYREFCQLSVPSDWSERPAEIRQQTWERIESVYENVEDIDPFTGGVAEESVPGGVVGPTFACIISKQFESIKRGDRLFFTHTYNQYEGGLPRGLRGMIRKRKLSDILCDNIPVEELPTNIFNVSSEKFPCTESQKLDFNTANSEMNGENVITTITTSVTTTHTTTSPTSSYKENIGSLGFLIAGGYVSGPGTLKSSELFNPQTGEGCSVGDLPDLRLAATLCNDILCGGIGGRRSCLMFDGIANWTSLPVSLVNQRAEHLCWSLPSGEVILLGGMFSGGMFTTERISPDGTTSTADFNLPYFARSI